MIPGRPPDDQAEAHFAERRLRSIAASAFALVGLSDRTKFLRKMVECCRERVCGRLASKSHGRWSHSSENWKVAGLFIGRPRLGRNRTG